MFEGEKRPPNTTFFLVSTLSFCHVRNQTQVLVLMANAFSSQAIWSSRSLTPAALERLNSLLSCPMWVSCCILYAHYQIAQAENWRRHPVPPPL